MAHQREKRRALEAVEALDAALTVDVDHTLDCDHYHTITMTIAHSVDHSYDHVDCAGVSPCNGEGLQCWHQGQGEENCDCK